MREFLFASRVAENVRNMAGLPVVSGNFTIRSHALAGQARWSARGAWSADALQT